MNTQQPTYMHELIHKAIVKETAKIYFVFGFFAGIAVCIIALILNEVL